MVTNLILMVIGICLVVYVWRGLSGVGWQMPDLGLGGNADWLPDTRGLGNLLGCKWNGSC
ncbi:hypothetical protein [Sulfitobacter aestuariivivens]|uniref:Uncharacterized protein n=1 Tax=Sulfitobacter aestuariivivens TaxID=2766981 RepID=A0A927D1U9_9RHOB|nr:hypothetical protein [Sulfitobacter aestuariivivens]MBD3663555.1 hypothetical protein [Sulfitobacter aestuariivivens]